jgi:GDP-D-mannose 3', 5'-epimerase
LADVITKISGKQVTQKHLAGSQGVRGRNSDNRLIFEKLPWKPTPPLFIGMGLTYAWIENQVRK